MSSLSGLGIVGSWHVEIDTVHVGKDETWGITLSHPQMTLQFAVANLQVLRDAVMFLSVKERLSAVFSLECNENYEVLLCYDEERLTLRIVRPAQFSDSLYPWLLDCAFVATEGDDLAAALHEALTNQAE